MSRRIWRIVDVPEVAYTYEGRLAQEQSRRSTGGYELVTVLVEDGRTLEVPQEMLAPTNAIDRLAWVAHQEELDRIERHKAAVRSALTAWRAARDEENEWIQQDEVVLVAETLDGRGDWVTPECWSDALSATQSEFLGGLTPGYAAISLGELAAVAALSEIPRQGARAKVIRPPLTEGGKFLVLMLEPNHTLSLAPGDEERIDWYGIVRVLSEAAGRTKP